MGTKLAVDLLVIGLQHVTELTALIQTAQAQNRDVSEAELDGLAAKYQNARTAILEEAARQKAGG